MARPNATSLRARSEHVQGTAILLAPSESDRIQLIRHGSTKILHQYEVTALAFYERAEQRTSIGGKCQSTKKIAAQFPFQPHNLGDAAGREVDEFDKRFIVFSGHKIDAFVSYCPVSPFNTLEKQRLLAACNWNLPNLIGAAPIWNRRGISCRTTQRLQTLHCG